MLMSVWLPKEEYCIVLLSHLKHMSLTLCKLVMDTFGGVQEKNFFCLGLRPLEHLATRGEICLLSSDLQEKP